MHDRFEALDDLYMHKLLDSVIIGGNECNKEDF